MQVWSLLCWLQLTTLWTARLQKSHKLYHISLLLQTVPVPIPYPINSPHIYGIILNKKWNKIYTEPIIFFQFCFYLNKIQNKKNSASLNILGVYNPPECSHDQSQTANLCLRIPDLGNVSKNVLVWYSQV